jgi:hypothetical protein
MTLNEAHPPTASSLGRRWVKRTTYVCMLLFLLFGAAYAMRGTLLLNAARVYLDRDPALVVQEKADGVVIVFAEPPSPWVKPMKNVMNPMWQSIGAQGVNYYTFAGPSNPLRAYSERSVPTSPYYQAWVGAYVTKRRDGTLPPDLPAWAKQVTELDQRSWLAAMGDTQPLAESAAPTKVGSAVIDGRELELWHGTMLSHSDLSEKADTPLATLVGMPPRSSWPSGTQEFHKLMLDGYFVCWRDTTRQISIVVYGVAALSPYQPGSTGVSRRDIKDELLRLMKTATLKVVQ